MQKSRNLVKFILFTALIVLLFSLGVLEVNQKLGMILFAVGLGLCALGVHFLVTLCRCPHCGRVIFFGGLSHTHCPHCRKQLVSTSSSGSSSGKTSSNKSTHRKRR